MIVCCVMTTVTAASLSSVPSLPDSLFEPGETVRVGAVADGLTLTLDDGRILRLAGIDAPVFNGPHAALHLERMLVGQNVQLHYGAMRQDRWRRVMAHVVFDGGSDALVWVQGDLLTRGLARVFTTPDTLKGVSEMYRLEASARAAKRGLWADGRFAVRKLPLRERDLRSVQIVEGRIVDVANVRGRVYLNFGPDWKTDFTVLIPSVVRRQMEREGTDLAALKGHVVRVRGWVKEWNGPMIEIDHGAQLEVPAKPLEAPLETGVR